MMVFKCAVSIERHKEIIEQARRIVDALDLDQAAAFIYFHDIVEAAYKDEVENACSMK